MQTELSLRLLGPVCLPREPSYDPIKEGQNLLKINLETDSVDCYFAHLDSYSHANDDLWFLESSCAILQYIRSPYPGFDDWYHGLEFNHRRALVAFSLRAFHFQPILKELLDMCGFFGANIELAKYQHIVYVVLYKFIEHKFNFRPKLSDPSHRISLICQRIDKCRVRLNAELARLRVEEGATTLFHLLSEESRQQLDSQSNAVVYLRTTGLFREAMESLPECSFSRLLDELGVVGAANMEELLDLPPTARKFKYVSINRHLVAVGFHSYSFFEQHPLTRQGYLQLVDLSSYNLIAYASSHIATDDDVILTHFGTGAECIQLSESLNAGATLHVFSVDNVDVARVRLDQYSITNVRLYREGFGEIDNTTASLSTVKSVICLPPNSQDSIVSKLLPALTGAASLLVLFPSYQVDLTDILVEQRQTLSSTLSMSSVGRVLYFVHSNNPLESSEVVLKELEAHTSEADSLKQRTFSLQPVIHGLLSPDSEGLLSVTATSKRSGYFAAALVRKAPPPPPKPVEVIEKAVNEGVLQLSVSELEVISVKKADKAKKKQRTRKPLFSSSKEPIPMTFTARQKFTTKYLFVGTMSTKKLHSRPFR